MDSQSSDSPAKGRRLASASIALAVTVVALAAAVTAAWLLETNTSENAYNVTVRRGGATIATYGVQDLLDLDQVTIVAQGQEQVGPTLLALLHDAGVESFESITVRGMGLRDDGLIELGRRDVTPDVVLDFAERGTTKLCGPHIEWGDRVRDVQVIEVR